MQKIVVVTLSVFLAVLFFALLYLGKKVLLPFVIAVVIGYFIICTVSLIQRFTFQGKIIPLPLAYLLTFIFFSMAATLLYAGFSDNIGALRERAHFYQERLQHLSSALTHQLGLQELPDLSKYTANLDLGNLLSQVVLIAADLASNMGLILLYTVFVLIEHRFFPAKLRAFCQTEERRQNALALLNKITGQLQSYVWMKTAFSILTALCSYIVLILMGVDFPGFFAILIFVLNFIPAIGSIVATFFPCLIAFLQFDTLVPFAIVTVSLILIQFLFGSIVEPKVMGRSFQLSGLVIVLSLAVWGSIWGILGMFLSVPILMATNIVLANFEATRGIAILLSMDGKL